jgi:predicted ATPase
VNPQSIDIQLSPVTVFVGPNNSGKSLALKEIMKLCHNGAVESAKNLLVGGFTVNKLSPAETDMAIESFQMIQNSQVRPGTIH